MGSITRPHVADAPPADDVHELLERQSTGRDRLRWRNLDNPGLMDVFHALKHQERSVALALAPGRQLERVEVIDVVAAVDGNAHRCHPLLVDGPWVPGFLFGCSLGGRCHSSFLLCGWAKFSSWSAPSR